MANLIKKIWPYIIVMIVILFLLVYIEPLTMFII
jgi:TRAP-type C4-dicarboxylate transport system permease large subunit